MVELAPQFLAYWLELVEVAPWCARWHVFQDRLSAEFASELWHFEQGVGLNLTGTVFAQVERDLATPLNAGFDGGDRLPDGHGDCGLDALRE
jgi:hypothetical protein